MIYFLDTADLNELKKGIESFPIVGMTSNPTILARDAKVNPYQHMHDVEVLMEGRFITIQVVSTTSSDMIKEALRYQNDYKNIYIKIPCNQEGFKAMYYLSKQGIRILATACYSLAQCDMAAKCGAEYIAVYVNRMQINNFDVEHVLKDMVTLLNRDYPNAKLMAASFKTNEQVELVLRAGVHSMTAPLSIYENMVEHPLSIKAVEQFNLDWHNAFSI